MSETRNIDIDTSGCGCACIIVAIGILFFLLNLGKAVVEHGWPF